jgi:glycosyltransferase involved in cell wall biosynthesis
MKLSLLIASIESRSHLLARLKSRLEPQRVDDVELLIAIDDGQSPIGAKRNLLMWQARGDYVCFIDDDDLVSHDYVARILKAITLKPDCVGFWVNRYVNGVFDASACHSIRYKRYATNENGPERIYERTPNHLNPIRRELAVQVPFPELNTGEDTDYARRIYPLLRSEVFIYAPLYNYLYVGLDQRNEMTNAIRTYKSPSQWFSSQAVTA